MRVSRKILTFDETNRRDFFFCSDVHFGNVAADIKQFKKDLKEAKEREARILMIGDLFDSIYSKDPRHTPSILIPELQGRDDPIDFAIDLLTDILKPYADLIDGIGYGNHEESFIRYNATHPTKRLIHELELSTGAEISDLGYSGYVLYDLYKNNKKRNHFNILYHHGSGGGAPVTKGMININRKQTAWVYDLYIFGHKHRNIADNSVCILPHRASKPKNDWVEQRPMLSAQIGNYLRNYPKDEDGSLITYSEKREHIPSPIGGTFGYITLNSKNGKYKLSTTIEIRGNPGGT